MTLYHKISTLSKLIKLFTKISRISHVFFFFLPLLFPFLFWLIFRGIGQNKFTKNFGFLKREQRRRNYAITYIKTYSKNSLIKTVLV